MSTAWPDRIPRGWTRRQRNVLLGGLILLTGFLWFEFYRQPVYVDDPPAAQMSRADEVADRIDPNTAELSMLRALPNLGEKRAKEIVAYRERVLSSGRGTVAFRTGRDLLKVKGIGAGMLAQLRPYLRFPDEKPTTQP